MTFRFMKIWVLLLCSVFTAATFAQNSNSTIQGTVQDVSGAVVPGATVNLSNVGTGQQLSTMSRGDGFYTFTNLSPADYKVSVTAPGFAQWVGVLTLRVSQAAEVNPSLTAASVSTQVTVRDVTPVIDRVNPTLSDVKNATTIETLPVQNRSILNVLAFSPGVVAGGYGGSGGGYTRVNGIPGGSLDYLVDGQTMSNKFSNELQTNPQPVPTFQEVKIITANGDAQYSRPGIVELVTKSGTNNFHGQFFELNQNNYLRAKAAFSGPTINYLMHNEFGGQVGGPLWLPKLYNGRNKTFFFLDIEGIRENSAAVSQFSNPLAVWKTGDLSTLVDSANGSPITVYDPLTTSLNSITGAYERTQFPGNVIPTNRINPVAAKILTYLPDPNLSTPYWQGPNYAVPNESSFNNNNLYTAKVDQLFGPNRLAMRYTYTSRNTQSPYTQLNPNVAQDGGHNGAIVFTEVLGPRAINVVRAGVQYNHRFTGPKPISPPITETLGLPTYPDTIAWPGIFPGGNNDFAFSGIDRNNPKDYPDQTITASDQFSYNRGNHQLMAGFDIQNYRINTFEVGQPGGTYAASGNFTGLQDPSQVAGGTFDSAVPDTGAGLADFLLGDMDYLQQNIYPHYHTRQTEYAAYVQDNWRATQNLTLNLGLRWGYWSPFTDSSGLQSTLDPSVPGGMIVYQGSGALPAQTSQALLDSFLAAGLPLESAAKAGYPLGLWNMPKNNFQPRVGFAYQLSANKVLRGGWGIYQWVFPLGQYQQTTRKNVPFSYSLVLQPGQVNGAATDAGAAELEFPIASSQYGGAQPLTQFMLGSSTLVLNPTDLVRGNGFAETPFDPNFKPQTVQEYNLTFAEELPKHIGFQLSYIGNHSTHLPQLDPINFTIPRELCPNPSCTPAQRRRFPLFATSGTSSMSELRWIGYAYNNELQAQVQHTFGNGLLLQSYFTWQRTLTTTENTNLGTLGNASEMLPSALTNNAPDSERLRAVYAPDGTLPTKTFSLNAHYEFPFGKGKRYLGESHGLVNALVSGYNISPFFLWHSGLYFAPYYTPFGSAVVLAPGKTGILPAGQRTRSRWFDPSLDRADLGIPYTGQTYIQRANTLDNDFRNNVPRNYMTGPGFNELDATIYKLTPITKGTVLDIEAQIFNVYNHQNLALPNTNNSGRITAPLSGSLPRLIQLQAKFIF